MAENLLWLGRYAERCDNIARLLCIALNFLFNVRFDQRGAEWPTVEALCIWFQLTDGDKRPLGGQAVQMQSQGGQSQSQGQAAAIFTDAELESALLLAAVSPSVPGECRCNRKR